MHQGRRKRGRERERGRGQDKERERGREGGMKGRRENLPSAGSFTPQIATTAEAGPSQTQELHLGLPQALGPSSAVFRVHIRRELDQKYATATLNQAL